MPVPPLSRPVASVPRPLLGAVVGLGIVGALAGCAAPSSGSGSTGDDAGSTTTDGDYTDGTYVGEGDYQSPGGQESIEVKLTLADNVITEIEVTPHASSGNAKQYQTQFASGISDEVVGQDIDELQVTRVSGSSLTSGGFDKAIEQIKTLASTAS